MRTIVFLNDAPGPRAFWARRQCHETTIHAVDALAGALGRYPTAADTWIVPAVALDGIDELLAGFMTRNKSRLRSDQPLTVGVLADESPTGWLVEVGPAPAVVTVAAQGRGRRTRRRTAGRAGGRGVPNSLEPLRRARPRRPLEGRPHHVGVTVRSRSGRGGNKPERRRAKPRRTAMTPHIQRTALAAALLALIGLAYACGSGDDDDGREAADPRSYYDNYQEGVDEGGAARATSSQAGGPAMSAGDVGEPGLLEDNTFVDAGMSGFVDPSIDPESTFALDVDNGSFRVAQALVAQGLRPPAESVRSEEWVNALPYDDPAPTEADLALRTESGMAPALDDGTQEVRVAVTARDLAAVRTGRR